MKELSFKDKRDILLGKRGSEDDFWKDLVGDLEHIDSFAEFKEDLPHLIGYIQALKTFSEHKDHKIIEIELEIKANEHR